MASWNLAGESKAFAAFISIYSWNNPCQNLPRSAKRRLKEPVLVQLKPKLPGLSLVLATPCSSHPSFFIFYLFYQRVLSHCQSTVRSRLSSTSLEKLFEMHKSELSPATPSLSCFPVAFNFSMNSHHLIRLSFPKLVLMSPQWAQKGQSELEDGKGFSNANYFSGLDFWVKFWR